MKMKTGCIILSITIFLAIMAVCVMVKFATDITVVERKREFVSPTVYTLPKSMGVITLNDDLSMSMVERFPYIAAVTRNDSSLWYFACFASVVLLNWVVTAAHCSCLVFIVLLPLSCVSDSVVQPGALHRVLLFQDFARNYTHTHPVWYWRLHEQFNISDPSCKYDIAVAKINLDTFARRVSVFDDKKTTHFDLALWKTVSTMNRKLYLTNDFGKISVLAADFSKCLKSYGVAQDESLICIDLSHYDDCFVHDFGPLYAENKVVGILALKPADCNVKYAIFTNVSYYTSWIIKSTDNILD